MTPATIFTLFSEAADKAGDKTALVALDAQFTFQELHADIRLLAGHFLQRSEAGPVALLTEDAKALLTAFFACAAAGRPALILDPARPAAACRDLAERHDVMLFALDRRLAALFPEERSLILDPPPASAAIPLPSVASEAEFYWGLTSGTTGEPKLFARSHRSWLESFRAAGQVFAFPPAAQVLIPGPLSHSLFLYGAVQALCHGHTVIAPGPFRPDRAIVAAREADCAYLVPAMLAEMLGCGLDAARLRLIFCGGAKLSAALRQRCEALLPRADLVEFYGASETSFVTFASTSAPAPASSVGRPFPGVRVAIREGEVHIASPMLFSRYVGGPAAPSWFTAGDLGFIDDGGFLHLTGRVNRVINSRALKIRPEPIEEALLELPGVLRAAVVDLPDPIRGAIAVAALEFAPGKRLARRILSQHCRAKVGWRFSPRRYYEATSMPLTPSGKIALASLREALIAGSQTLRELR